MSTTKKRALRSFATELKSEYFVDKVKKSSSINESVKKIRKENNLIHIRPVYDQSESEEIVNTKCVQPPHWEEVYGNIKEMRMRRDAAVDHMGAEKCRDENSPPKVQRLHTLVSLMLSSQTKDGVTHAAMTRLKEHGLTVDRLLHTTEDAMQKLIYPVGFYKRKAEYILRTCKILHEKYDSDIPSTLKELCSLPGVGHKMAYLCLDIAWNKIEGIGVDTHVHRISNRLGWTCQKAPTKTPEATRKALENWLPKEHWSEVNLLLVGFGQQICLPVSPKCSECLNQQLCPYGKRTQSTATKASPSKIKRTLK